MKKDFVKSILGASALAMLFAVPALAQAQTKPEEEKKAEAKKATSETVVITGSRIRRDAFSQTSPLQVITNQNAKLAGKTDGVKVVQGASAAAGSTQINNFFSGFVVEGGPGIQTVGLNSLGSQRTLVMLNTHRMPPSGTRGQVGAVDLQTIPNLAISRFEILNEGASPIYGSDAVGGVVNAITRKDVNGFEVDASGSFTTGGGGEFGSVGALWGKTSDKWNAMISAEYSEQKALKLGDRDFCQEDYYFNPTTGERVDYVNPTTGKYYCLGVNGASFDRVSLGGTALTGAGTWVLDPTSTTTVIGTNPQTGAANTKLKVPGYKRIFSPTVGTLGTPLAYQLNYKSPFIDSSDLVSPSKRTNVYGTFSRDLDVLGGIEWFGEGLYSNRESTQTRGAQLFFAIPGTNVYNPWGATAQPVISRPANNEQTVQAWQVVTGVRGKTGAGLGGFFKNGDWEIYGQTSSSTGKYSGTTIRADRVAASLQTTITGGVASCPTPTYGGSCLPINFFDPRVLTGNYSQAEYDYLFGAPNEGKTVYEQTAFEANISGDVFKIPGAKDDAKLNIGAYYRKYSIDDVPGVETVRGNTLLSTSAGITRGEDSVKELFGELDVPVVSKKPFVEDLSVKLAYRFTDYDSYSSNSTWKSTVSWRITPQFQLIANSGTSYRAPQLFELYLSNQTGFLSQGSIDPCVNWDLSNSNLIQQRCAAAGIPAGYAGLGSSATIISSGGKGRLKEEESRSDIYSVVWTPTFADLKLRADYWRINVSDQITNFGGSIVGACYGTPNETVRQYFCSKFTRDPSTFSILTVNASYENIDAQDVRGIDFKLLYRKEFPLGNLTVDSQHRWTLNNKSTLFPGADTSDSAGTIGEPVYNSTNQLRFDHKDWTFAWTVDAFGPASDVRFYGSDTLPIAAGSNYTFKGLTALKYKMRTETTIYHAASVRYRNDNWTLIGGVNNIFNEAPPAVSSGIASRLGNAALTSQYDLVGRSVFLSATRRF